MFCHNGLHYEMLIPCPRSGLTWQIRILLFSRRLKSSRRKYATAEHEVHLLRVEQRQRKRRGNLFNRFRVSRLLLNTNEYFIFMNVHSKHVKKRYILY